MKRLTEKYDDNKYTHACGTNDFMYGDGCDILCTKLGKLEDIETDLGIPLEVLFKALKDGIYRFYEEFEDVPPSIYYLDPTIMYDEWKDRWIFYDDSRGQFYCLKDYGKTWALTREELENAKD